MSSFDEQYTFHAEMCVKFIIWLYFPFSLYLFRSVKYDDRMIGIMWFLVFTQYGKLSFVTSVVFISMRLPVRRAWLSASLYIRHFIHLYYLALHNGERSTNENGGYTCFNSDTSTGFLQWNDYSCYKIGEVNFSAFAPLNHSPCDHYVTVISFSITDIMYLHWNNVFYQNW